MKQADWKKLLKNKDVKRWFDNLARGSEITAEENLRVLNRYTKHHNITPIELVEIARKNKREVEDQLRDFVTELTKEGKAPSYISNYIKSVKSWLRENDIILGRIGSKEKIINSIKAGRHTEKFAGIQIKYTSVLMEIDQLLILRRDFH